jgi:hypothetical protein
MKDMIDTVNPYHSTYASAVGLASAPFAGRKEAFARLYSRLYDSVNTGAILFLGQKHIGKTALLLNTDSIFKETAVGIYISMRELQVQGEAQWLLALAQTITDTLIEAGFTLSRLSQLDPLGEQPRDWLEVTFLPQILGAVKRKILILIDDADRLLALVRNGQLPADTFNYLYSIAKKYQDLHVALTLDSDYEDDIPAFAPLVMSTDVVRLSNLAPDETTWLLQAPVRGVYSVPDEVAQAIHRAVGGAPGMVQHFGYELFRRWETYPELNVFTLEDVRALTPTLYLYNEGDYRALWESLSVNERLVLTAISDMAYTDPLGKIDASGIQHWLSETDFPLDVTAINATLRSLEYREILHPTPLGISLSASILQSWLLENARLGRRTASPGLTNAPATPAASAPARPPGLAGLATPRVLRTLAVIFVLLVIANVLAYAWVNGGSSSQNPSTNLEPTVTLVGQP